MKTKTATQSITAKNEVSVFLAISVENLTNIKPIISDDEWKHITKFLEFLVDNF